MIDSVLEPELYRAIAAKAQDMGGFVHALGGSEDHAHLAVSIPPKIAPAKFIGDVKGNSSHYVNHVIKPDFEFHWQDEYGVLSFGEKKLSSVVRYIHNQSHHHADGTLTTIMERMDENDLREINYLMQLSPHGDKPPCYTYKARYPQGASQSGLGGLSRLRRRSRGGLSHGGFAE